MIRFKAATKRYDGVDGEHTAIQDVSFHVGDGEFVCLLGPSGCGKSTVLNLVAGFLLPSSGSVFFDDRLVTEPGPERGVVFQEPTLFPWLTVRGNVEFGLAAAGMPRQKRKELAGAALELVGLSGFEAEYPHTLSAGMQQRVALARVLVFEPRALLMDEPFSSLDANSRERLQDEVLRIWQCRRRTVLFVTHNVDEAVYLADRVIVMGPPPRSIRGEVVIDLARPRDRSSDTLRLRARELRKLLDQMHCCSVP